MKFTTVAALAGTALAAPAMQGSSYREHQHHRLVNHVSNVDAAHTKNGYNVPVAYRQVDEDAGGSGVLLGEEDTVGGLTEDEGEDEAEDEEQASGRTLLERQELGDELSPLADEELDEDETSDLTDSQDILEEESQLEGLDIPKRQLDSYEELYEELIRNQGLTERDEGHGQIEKRQLPIDTVLKLVTGVLGGLGKRDEIPGQVEKRQVDQVLGLVMGALGGLAPPQPETPVVDPIGDLKEEDDRFDEFDEEFDSVQGLEDEEEDEFEELDELASDEEPLDTLSDSPAAPLEQPPAPAAPAPASAPAPAGPASRFIDPIKTQAKATKEAAMQKRDIDEDVKTIMAANTDKEVMDVLMKIMNDFYDEESNAADAVLAPKPAAQPAPAPASQPAPASDAAPKAASAPEPQSASQQAPAPAPAAPKPASAAQQAPKPASKLAEPASAPEPKTASKAKAGAEEAPVPEAASKSKAGAEQAPAPKPAPAPMAPSPVDALTMTLNPAPGQASPADAINNSLKAIL